MKVNTTTSLKDEQEFVKEDSILRKFMKDHKKKTVTIPHVDGQDDVLECCINGYNILLKRGEPVELPENIVALLQNAQVL